MNPSPRPISATLVAWAVASSLGLGVAPTARAQDGAALHARYQGLRGPLAASPFGRPLVLESVQNSNDLRGDVVAVVEQPFATVSPALQGADHWCEVLMLHLNVKGCRTAGPAAGGMLSLVVGRKFDQPLGDGYKVDFTYAPPVTAPDYLRVQMTAAEGPVGTHDYALVLEATPLDERRSLIHLSYAYAYGTAARLGMQAYLSTAGRDKVGFSITGTAADGKPTYIGGVRGVIERNTMRYYLAIETYLGSLAAPAAERQEKRLRDWFDATERHALQLHEMTRDEYLAMKRHELQQPAPGS
ncbi:MAG: hypothetical protein M3O01_06515 [Pseudomonadota bacterium]|nr:hypothetical protein [Pseudomonadota bacterium]